ncbi:Protein of unknown function [Pyronema omphalodes CBS 100304]|uniref:Uncharacterized protein n=1 Tax=Pyronema omphalodes (strain CBS 100304) TaxID=1076935 RepID=U4KYW4_PYROM|nr:Protein of unknown function [Pyronema omphalodes CBS 100304]
MGANHSPDVANLYCALEEANCNVNQTRHDHEDMVEKDDVKDVKARRLKCLTILKKRDGGAHEVMEAYNELCEKCQQSEPEQSE